MPLFFLAFVFTLLEPRSTTLQSWGTESLQSIEQNFALPAPNQGRYREKMGSNQICYAWPLGVQLSALTAAASMDERYAPRLRQMIDAMDSYWRIDDNKLGGYDASSGNTGALDRYYDDNAWLVLGLVEAYRVTKDPADLRRAEATLRFTLSGEDDTLGGGIWWHEINRKSKNTCSTGPAIVACLAVDSITGKPDHLKTASRLHDWTDANLRDNVGDGLYFDNLNLDRTLGQAKWSYNTALMIRAKCMLFDATREQKYLDDAEHLATAAKKHWANNDTGVIADDSQFAHLLAEAFLELAARLPDETACDEWRETVWRSLEFVHDRNVDAAGMHPKRWEAEPREPVTTPELIWQASAARAYWRAARALNK
ncbi:MAG: hypothetical protein H7Z14_12235 [Anaerolineae bacterium]|nr:hypothetical protein [Phycisphaerae bacterium]